MKTLAILSLALFSSLAFAAPDAVPGVDARAANLGRKIDADLSAGKLAKTDGDELKRALGRVKKMEEEAQRSGRITSRTRGDMRLDLDKVEVNLARKEKQHAAAAASPAAQ